MWFIPSTTVPGVLDLICPDHHHHPLSRSFARALAKLRLCDFHGRYGGGREAKGVCNRLVSSYFCSLDQAPLSCDASFFFGRLDAWCRSYTRADTIESMCTMLLRVVMRCGWPCLLSYCVRRFDSGKCLENISALLLCRTSKCLGARNPRFTNYCVVVDQESLLPTGSG